MNPYGYSEINLERRRDNYRIRIYNDNNQEFRVYNGHNLVFEGNDHGAADQAYQKEV